jgi:uncharacterized membrane protein YgcG
LVAAAVATAPVARKRVNFGIAQYESSSEGPSLAVAMRGGIFGGLKEEDALAGWMGVENEAGREKESVFPLQSEKVKKKNRKKEWLADLVINKRMLLLSRRIQMLASSSCFSLSSLSASSRATPRPPAGWRDVRAMSTPADSNSGAGGRERRGGGGNRGKGGGRGGGGGRSGGGRSGGGSTSSPSSSSFISLPPPSEAAVSALTASAAEHNIPVVVLKGGRSKIFRGE